MNRKPKSTGSQPSKTATARKRCREDAAGKPAEKASPLPEILLIGDSIRIGYCKYVAEALRNKADVKWPEENCRSSQYILMSLEWWRGIAASPAVVQFNCGHWDAARWDGDGGALTSIEEFGRNVRLIIRRIRRYWPEAKIVFATSTPMNPDGTRTKNHRTTKTMIRYNAKAVKVAQDEGAEVNDLFEATKEWPATDYRDYAHFTEDASRRLGEIVARRLAAVAGLR